MNKIPIPTALLNAHVDFESVGVEPRDGSAPREVIISDTQEALEVGVASWYASLKTTYQVSWSVQSDFLDALAKDGIDYAIEGNLEHWFIEASDEDLTYIKMKYF